MADTTLSAGIVIDGNLESEGSVRLDGKIQGRLNAKGNVELGVASSVAADLRGARVSIAGHVAGNVEATERVDLLSGSRLTGNVRAPRLTIADGATFRGKVDMDV